MNYLTQGGLTETKFNLLIKLTSLRSSDQVNALFAYCVKGHSQETAINTYDVNKSNFNRAFKILNEAVRIVELIKDEDWQKFKSEKRQLEQV